MEGENSKVLGLGDIADRFVVPQSWMNTLRPLFANGKNEVLLRVLCWLGYAWEFRCTIRGTGPYEKPTLQALEWKRFVNYTGLRVGDKIILQEEENQDRGTNYSIRAQRRDADGQWADVEPPRHHDAAFYQFNI